MHFVYMYIFRFKSAMITDKRVKVMNEVVLGMRLIKMYAWELAFKKVVTALRRFIHTYVHTYMHVLYMYLLSSLLCNAYAVYILLTQLNNTADTANTKHKDDSDS